MFNLHVNNYTQVVFISLMVKQREAACLGIVILLALVTTAILTITHFKVYHKHQVLNSHPDSVTQCLSQCSLTF